MLLSRWITLRSLRARPLRTFLSAFGIILGVAGLLAIQITNGAALESLSALFEGTAGKADLVVTNAAGADGESLPERVLRRLEGSQVVKAAVPSLQLRTTLAVQLPDSAISLSLLGFDMGGFVVYGIDPLADPAVRDYKLKQGSFLSPSGGVQEIVLVENYAAENNLKVGNIIELLAADGPQEFKIVGLIAKEGAGLNNNGAFGVIPLRTAQELFNRTGELDQIEIVLKPQYGALREQESAKAELQSRLGGAYSITTTAAKGERVNQMLSGFSIGLNFMGGMALFVGAYLIYNTFSMTVIERTREFGLLRTLGLSRQQVVLQVLVEAGILGLAGSLAGALLGIGLAQGAARLLSSLLDLDAIPTPVNVPTILFSLLIGILVTVIAALIPAWQAGRISPLEALRVRGVRKEGWLLRHGWKLGMVMLLIFTIILVANPFPYDVQFRLGSITVVLLFFGGTLLIPGSVEIWERLTRPLVSGLYGAAGRLGSSNLQRSKLRTTLTVAALMVGVSMIIITRGMTDSFRGDLEVWIDAYIGGDLMVNSPTPMRNQVMRRLEAMPGVAAVTPMRTLPVSWQRPDGAVENLVFMGVEPATYLRVTGFVFSDSQVDAAAATRQLSAGNTLFISSVLAEKYDLQPGDVLRLRTRSGDQDFHIAAVVVSFFNQGLTVHGSWSDMRRYFKTSDASAYLVKVAQGYPKETVRLRIEDAFAKRQGLSVISNQAVIDQVFRLLNQAYSMFDVMAIIAMLVGALGVVNTLTMNVAERIQEIGMLRSIGLTRGQTLVMVLAESLVMGLIGGVLGLAFGVLLTRIFLWSMTAMSGYKINFVMPVMAVAAGLVIALLVSQLAAIFPARRAARTRILDAIHYE
jgi:putative ABC transport system permease protein